MKILRKIYDLLTDCPKADSNTDRFRRLAGNGWDQEGLDNSGAAVEAVGGRMNTPGIAANHHRLRLEAVPRSSSESGGYQAKGISRGQERGKHQHILCPETPHSGCKRPALISGALTFPHILAPLQPGAALKNPAS
ncbi:hypothetical protein R5R35_014204 [Gryllus longicercus]|uniref:Uncharacterized protein n=1 Tax=Gryllus longicercus TaxID=2509291 RepID=A0AAN9VYT1_9ORTH